MLQTTTDTTLSKPKIRVLGIAPYEGMETLMEKLAARRDDLLLDVYVGDLRQGVEIAKRTCHFNYDVIVSRGGTAQMIREITHVPVVDIGLSGYDILRVMKLSENYSRKYAMVGFPNITSHARLLCDLLQYQMDIFTIHSSDEVWDTLSDLKERGYEMILCDVITNTAAKKLGLNALLITSGAESISAAFDQAVKLCGDYHTIQSEKHFFMDILRNGNDQTIVLKENGELFFSTIDEEQLPAFCEVLRKDLASLFDKRTHKLFKNIDGTLYTFTCRYLTCLDEQYAAFYGSPTPVPPSTGKYGIQYLNLQETEDLFFDSFFNLTNDHTTIRTTVQNITQTDSPIMISGESGSGKEQIARKIHSQSQFSGNPLITIDCTLLNERSWNFLVNHCNSPFNDNGNTIYLKNIQALSRERCSHLLALTMDTNLCKRNRMIFSCSCPMGHGLSAQAMEFVNLLSCVTIHLPPLRDYAREIPALASLYLNMFNLSMENQVIGLEPEALKLLQDYNWPYNYTQFKRIINELMLAATTPYICAEHVAALLKKEEQPASFPNPSGSFTAAASPNETYTLDLTKPLNDITQDIVRIVLSETHGNQSAAAKRLGIARSTLWRYLK